MNDGMSFFCCSQPLAACWVLPRGVFPIRALFVLFGQGAGFSVMPAYPEKSTPRNRFRSDQD